MEYTVGLALLDYVPVFAYLFGLIFLVRAFVAAQRRPLGRMAMAAGLLIFLAGFLKATWKLLYAASGGSIDIQPMSQVQFMLHAPGFFAMLVCTILFARQKVQRAAALPLMSMAPWKIPLLMVMTISMMGAHGILAWLSFRRGLRLAAWFFVISCLVMVAMAGMAGRNQGVAIQWCEEGINAVGQICFALAAYLLNKNIRQNGWAV